jgi:ubiquinone/menaquinone biosynthesis C-methylase UbiE
MAKDPQQQTLFDRSWNLYKKIVAADFMHHRRLQELAADEIRVMESEQPISILDIGCGDGSPFIPLLDIRPVASYTGYDLSEVAIEYSRSNLSSIQVPFELKTGNMTELILKENQAFDLIYSSYVIHHLSDQDKSNFFSQIAQKLNPGGIFIYIDVVREDNQSLDQYRKEYTAKVLGWDILDQKEKQEVVDHVSQYDFPARNADLLVWFSASEMELIRAERGDEKHRFFSLKKAARSNAAITT